MARRNEHSLAEIKTMVLDAAESIIINEGFSALTIRKIAMEMGYTIGSIYMVFESRAELILHLNARTLEELAVQLQPVNHSGDVEAWLKAYLRYARNHPHRWRMIFTLSSPQNKPLPDWYQAHLNSLFEQFATYFSEQPSLVVKALWQGIHGICLLSAEQEVEAEVLSLLRIFLFGLSVRQT